MISPRVLPLECKTLLVFALPPVEILVEGGAAAKPVVKLTTQALTPFVRETIEYLPSI